MSTYTSGALGILFIAVLATTAQTLSAHEIVSEDASSSAHVETMEPAQANLHTKDSKGHEHPQSWSLFAFFKNILLSWKHGLHEDPKQSAPTVVSHFHPALDISDWPQKPSVQVHMHPDAIDGWNLEILTQGFRFAPEHVNGAVVANEGHAHLYIDGVKITRLYGNWYLVPSKLIEGSGAHEIVVTLNGNDHSDLLYKGARIEAKTSVMQ
ncbi:MAG: hypothetical protein WAZ27_01165 [Minisyncoccia bacterium]